MLFCNIKHIKFLFHFFLHWINDIFPARASTVRIQVCFGLSDKHEKPSMTLALCPCCRWTLYMHDIHFEVNIAYCLPFWNYMSETQESDRQTDRGCFVIWPISLWPPHQMSTFKHLGVSLNIWQYYRDCRPIKRKLFRQKKYWQRVHSLSENTETSTLWWSWVIYWHKQFYKERITHSHISICADIKPFKTTFISRITQEAF